MVDRFGSVCLVMETFQPVQIYIAENEFVTKADQRLFIHVSSCAISFQLVKIAIVNVIIKTLYY